MSTFWSASIRRWKGGVCLVFDSIGLLRTARWQWDGTMTIVDYQSISQIAHGAPTTPNRIAMGRQNLPDSAGVPHAMSEPNHARPAASYSDEASWPIMICLLGNFRLLAAGELIPIRAGGKSEALLSLLALQSGRRIAREQLVQAIWPESDLALGLRSLNTLVYRLHKLLGPPLQGATPILHEDGYYRLNVAAGIGVDVTSFDRLVAEGDQQLRAGNTAVALVAYQRAAELYRDDLRLATGTHTVMERERLRARYLTLLAEVAELRYRAGDYRAALEYLWHLLTRDPYREDAHRLVMRCYVRHGERAAALHQYQVCMDVLRVEFDTAPEAATVALYEQIRLDPDHL
jgi:DNA-binding SARP family transcriptional activator